MRRGALLSVLLAVAFAAPAPALAKRKKPRRYAWVGLERGPLAPKAARQLETLLVDELNGYDSFRLVDASGHALDRRLLGDDAALVSKLKNEGVDLFLRFKHQQALEKLEKAISIFESRLVTLEDYELVHDALLAKAEAQHQSGEHGAAKATLKHLLALGPKISPNARTHSAKFVRLWDAAKREMGAVGRIEIECADPGCLVQVDGQRLGEAPLVATRILPGEHYVVATWPHGVLKTTVRVAAGREAKVRLERTGPAEEARRAMLEVIQRRRGKEAAPEFGTRIASLARAWTTLIGAVKKGPDGKLWLFIARHGSGGPLRAVGRVPLDAEVDSERVARNVKRLCAALFVDQRAEEFSIDDGGALTVETGVAEALYASRISIDAADAPPPPPPPGGTAFVTPPPPPTGDDDGLLSQWWFWAIVGGAAAAGTIAGVVLLSPDPATTKFEVRLP